MWLSTTPTMAADFWGRDPRTFTPRFCAPSPVGARRNARRVAPVAKVSAKPVPKRIAGIALVFNRIFLPCHSFDDKRTRVAVLPGALDRSLRRITEGRASCPLAVGHGGEVLTHDFALTIEGNELMVRTRDRLTLAYLRGSKPRGLSIGLDQVESEIMDADPSPLAMIYKARLYEISVVDNPGCDGCQLFLY